MLANITNMENTRKKVMISFSIIGLLSVLTGIAFIIISFTFNRSHIFDKNESESEFTAP